MAPTKKQQPKSKTSTLCKKVTVIEEKEKSDIWKSSVSWKIWSGKTQIKSTIKDQMQILADFENNNPLEHKKTMKNRKCKDQCVDMRVV